MILSLVVESAPKRFLLETDGESNEEKQEIDENDDTVAAIPHAAAPRGWMDRMKKQRMKRKNNNDFGREGRNRNMLPTWIKKWHFDTTKNFGHIKVRKQKQLESNPLF